MNIILCNIGTRDVRIVGQPPDKNKSIRDEGLALLNHFDQVLPQLTLPVVEPTLAYITDNFQNAVDSILFIGTDQPDTPENSQFSDAGISFRDKDTLFYAELIKRAIKIKYPELAGDVQSDTISVNPSLYDEAFDAYEELLQKHFPDKKSVSICYVLIGSGTPACNTALILQSIRHFGNACHVIYKPHQAPPRELDAGRQVMHVLHENTAIQLLNRFDFDAAFHFLEKCDASPLVMSLTRYAAARLWFAFDLAQEHLNEAIKRSRKQTRTNLLVIQTDLTDLTVKKDNLALIGELYHNARIAWGNGRLIDFLGRASRFLEAVLVYLAQRMYQEGNLKQQITENDLVSQPKLRGILLDTLTLQYKTDAAESHQSLTKTQRRELRDLLEKHFDLAELRALCFDLTIDFENVRGDTKQGKVIELIQYAERQQIIVEFVNTLRERRPRADWPQSKNEGKQLSAIFPIFRGLEQLANLRQNTIIAHGYQGVSQEIIYDYYHTGQAVSEGSNPLTDMAVVCAVLGISTVNPFRDIRDLILAEL